MIDDVMNDEAQRPTSIYNLTFELGRIRVRPLSRSPSGNRQRTPELVARLRRRPRSSSGLRLQLGLRKAPGTRPGRAAWPPRAKTRTLSRPGVHLKLPAAWRPGPCQRTGAVTATVAPAQSNDHRPATIEAPLSAAAGPGLDGA